MGKSSDYQKEKREKQMQRMRRYREELPECAYPYLDSLSVDYRPATVLAYARDLTTFFEYMMDANPSIPSMKSISMAHLACVNAQDLMEYRSYLSYHDGGHPHNAQPESIDRRMTPVRGLFATLTGLGYLDQDPTSAVTGRRKKRADKHEIVYLEPDEVHELLDAIMESRAGTDRQQLFAKKTQKRDTAIVTLLLNTGIRVSELVGIDLPDLNLSDNFVRVVRKGGAEQAVYFPDNVRDALKEYLEEERPRFVRAEGEQALFLSSRQGRITVRAVQYMVKKFARMAVPQKRISPHKMRSTYATALYDETSDIRLVADVLGHESVDTTARHYASAKERHRREAGRMDLYGSGKAGNGNQNGPQG